MSIMPPAAYRFVLASAFVILCLSNNTRVWADEKPYGLTTQDYFDALLLAPNATDPHTHLTSSLGSAHLALMSPEQLRTGMSQMIKALDLGNGSVEERCATALGRLAPEGVAAVIAHVRSRVKSPEHRILDGGRVLACLGVENGVVVAKLLSDEDTPTAAAAVVAVRQLVYRTDGKRLSAEAVDLIRRAQPRLARFQKRGYGRETWLVAAANSAQDLIMGMAPGRPLADPAAARDLKRSPSQSDADYARQLGQQMASPLVSVRLQAIQSLIKLGPVATPELARATDDDADNVRSLALRALVQFYHPDADDPLRSADERAKRIRPPHDQKPGWPVRLEGANLDALRAIIPGLTQMTSDSTRRVRLLGLLAPLDPHAAEALVALARNERLLQARRVDEWELIDALASAGSSVRPALEAIAAQVPAAPGNARPRMQGQLTSARVASAALDRIALAAPPSQAGPVNSEMLSRLVEAVADARLQESATLSLRAMGDKAVPAVIQAYLAEPVYYKRERYAAVWAGTNNHLAIDLLARRARGTSNEASAAVNLLSRIGPDAGLPLTAMLSSSDVRDRRTGASALYQMGPLLAHLTALQQKGIVATLAAAVHDPDGTVSPNAAGALGRMGKAGIDQLAQLSKDPDARIRRMAVEGLIHGDDSATMPLLQAALDPDESIAALAGNEVLKHGQGPIPELKRMLADGTGRQRVIAAMMLAHSIDYTTTSAQLDRVKITDLIISALKSEPNPATRQGLISALGFAGAPAAAVALAPLVASTDPKAATQALVALMRTDIADAGPILAVARAARTGLNSSVRQQAVYALQSMFVRVDQHGFGRGSIGIPSAAISPGLCGATKSADPLSRTDAYVGLAAVCLATPDALSAYRRGTDDPDPRVRAAALEAMTRAVTGHDRDPKAAAVLLDAFNSPRSDVHNLAGFGIAATANRADWSAAVPRLKQLIVGADAGEHGMATVVLLSIEEMKPLKTVTISDLAIAARHPQAWVRHRAMERLMGFPQGTPGSAEARLRLLHEVADPDRELAQDAAKALLGIRLDPGSLPAILSTPGLSTRPTTGPVNPPIAWQFAASREAQQWILDLGSPDPAVRKRAAHSLQAYIRQKLAIPDVAPSS